MTGPKKQQIDAVFGARIPKFMDNGAVALFFREEGQAGYLVELFEPPDETPYWSARRTEIIHAIRAAENACKKPPSFYKEQQ